MIGPENAGAFGAHTGDENKATNATTGEESRHVHPNGVTHHHAQQGQERQHDGSGVRALKCGLGAGFVPVLVVDAVANVVEDPGERHAVGFGDAPRMTHEAERQDGGLFQFGAAEPPVAQRRAATVISRRSSGSVRFGRQAVRAAPMVAPACNSPTMSVSMVALSARCRAA